MKRTAWCALFVGATATAAPLGMDQFHAWDYNRDGYVDAAEATSSVDLSGRFNEIDLDRDGRISTTEMQAWVDRPAAKRGAWPPSPINADEQWRAIEARRAEREADRAQRILDGEALPPREAADAFVIGAPRAGAGDASTVFGAPPSVSPLTPQ